MLAVNLSHGCSGPLPLLRWRLLLSVYIAWSRTPSHNAPANSESALRLVLREAIQACRKGGVVSIPGVYGGMLDKLPFGASFNKGLVLKMGQTHMQRYTEPLLRRIQNGEIDPSFVITHRLALDEAPAAYKTFRDKQDECIKVVLDPWREAAAA